MSCHHVVPVYVAHVVSRFVAPLVFISMFLKFVVVFVHTYPETRGLYILMGGGSSARVNNV